MKSNRIRDSIVIGFAMFAIFFGAGNLIFPPQVGLVSGEGLAPALIGMALSGILLPMLAVAAVGNMGVTIEDMMRHIHPKLHAGFMVSCVCALCFGTMPRCGGVSYEIGLMGIFPSLPPISKWIYLLVFFGLAYLVARNRSGVIDTIGKYITPVLIITIFIIVVLTLIAPIGTPSGGIVDAPFSNAFVTSIQTGDTGTGIICAGIIIAAVSSKGYAYGKEQKQMLRNVIIVAFILLFIIYGGLCYLGACGTEYFAPDTDNTTLLVGLVQQLGGRTGMIILSIGIIFACFTTAAGMIATGADWIVALSKEKFDYKIVVAILTIVIMLVSSTGVSFILKLSGPLFVATFPICIILTVLGIGKKIIPNDGVWKGAGWVSIVIGILQGIQVGTLNGLIPMQISVNDNFLNWIPLGAEGFPWLIPSLLGGLIVGVIWKVQGRESLVDAIDAA